jgi:hypothetical protein
MDRNKAFKTLFDKYKSTFLKKRPGELQRCCTQFWNDKKCKENFPKLLELKLAELSNIEKRQKARLLEFWSNASVKLNNNNKLEKATQETSVGTFNATTDLKCTKSPDGIPPRTLKRRIDTNNTVKAGIGPSSIFGAE